MPDILIRRISSETLKRLEERAKRNGRSLQNEIKFLLEDAAGTAGLRTKRIFDKWRRKFAGRKFSSSVKLIREGRRNLR